MTIQEKYAELARLQAEEQILDVQLTFETEVERLDVEIDALKQRIAEKRKNLKQ